MYDVIVDLDGTLCNSEHRQHHMEGKKKNWKAFYEEMVNDEPNYDVKWVVEAMRQRHARIILCSGRPEEWRFQTEEWMIKHDVYYDALYMRATGDYRSDYIIKLELLEKMKLDGYDPKIAIDDRTQVVEAWRSVGIRCLQVAKGDF